MKKMVFLINSSAVSHCSLPEYYYVIMAHVELAENCVHCNSGFDKRSINTRTYSLLFSIPKKIVFRVGYKRYLLLKLYISRWLRLTKSVEYRFLKLQMWFLVEKLSSSSKGVPKFNSFGCARHFSGEIRVNVFIVHTFM